MLAAHQPPVAAPCGAPQAGPTSAVRPAWHSRNNRFGKSELETTTGFSRRPASSRLLPPARPPGSAVVAAQRAWRQARILSFRSEV